MQNSIRPNMKKPFDPKNLKLAALWKIEQTKAQYDLDRQTANISSWSSWNFGKYEFLTGEDVLPEKELLK